MIIEKAFYKLPYYLLKEGNEVSNESRLVLYFSWAIFLELQNMGVSNPFLIQIEKEYSTDREKENSKKKQRADIFVKIPLLTFSRPEEEEEYIRKVANHYTFEKNIFEENWTEVKFFRGLDEKEGDEAKTKNVADVIKDLLRLRNYASWDSGKYLLLCFDKDPRKYLAFGERKYLDELFNAGEKKVSFDLSGEPKTIVEGLNEELGDRDKFELKVLTLKIVPKRPETATDKSYFWLYLIKILPDENN